MDLRAEYLPLVVVLIFTGCSNGEATYIVYTGVFVYTSICSATCLVVLRWTIMVWLCALTNQQSYNSMYQAHTLDSYSHSWLAGVSIRQKYSTHTVCVCVCVCVCLCVCLVAGQNQATCDGMDDMIERSTALSCTKTPACNRADCTPTNPLLRGYSLSIELLSCRTPPGILLTLRCVSAIMMNVILC